MFKKHLPILFLLLCAGAASAQVYKWVDENGVVHYSDQPTEGAERIDIKQNAKRPPAQPRATQPAATRTRPEPKPQPTKPFSYESLSISSPVAEQTLWNIGGKLNVSLSVTPRLRNGDRVQLYFDGVARLINGLSVELEEVWRGTHNLQAEVVDANGTLMIRSEPMRFYVQQTSVAKK